MAENSITIRLCDEDRARLDKILAALEKGAPGCASCVESVTKAMGQLATNPPEEKPVQAASAPQEPSHPVDNPFPEPEPEPVPAPEPTPEPAKEEPTVTLEQIQQKVVKLAASGAGVKDPEGIARAKAKKARLREIVNAHAQKVSDLPPESWPTVWAELVKLESEG